MLFVSTICYGFQFTRILNTDTPGNNMVTYSSLSVDNCEAKCLGFVYCAGFVFQNSTNQCKIKAQMNLRTATTGPDAVDAYYKPQQQFTQIKLTQPDLVFGYFNTLVQNIVIWGSGFGVLSNTRKQYLLIDYLDGSNSTLFSQNRTSDVWNDISIELQFPILDDLKYYNMYKPVYINITVLNNMAVASFIVNVKYPSNFGTSLNQGPFKCYFGNEAMKTDPFTRFIHMDAGEDLKMNIYAPIGFPTNFVAIQKYNESSFLSSQQAANWGQQFGDLNAFSQLLTGYLFINTSQGYLIYNNGKYLGYDFDMFSHYWYNHDINTFDITDTRVVYWNCTNSFSELPSISSNSFQTNSSYFDVDLQIINIFGNSFGTFSNNLVNKVEFEMIKGNKVILTETRSADSWSDTNIIVSYPQLNDLRLYYAYKPEFVNVVVHTTTELLALKLSVRMPLLNTSKPFKCYHSDGRIWRNDLGNMKLDAGSAVEMTVDIAVHPIFNSLSQVAIKENVTGNYFRHSGGEIFAHGLGGLLLDFPFLIIATSQGFAFQNMYQYYWGRYIGYESDQMHTIVAGEPIFMFWTCDIPVEYSFKTNLASKSTNIQTTRLLTNLNEMGSTAIVNALSSHVSMTIVTTTQSIEYIITGPTSTIYIGSGMLPVLRESISFIFILKLFHILIKRHRRRNGHGKKKETAQLSFNFED